ncbi:MAG: hypothetical protein Q8P79_00855 [Nanoarchaeota archaeon]|nr:hypothetical protein [Nanoarchaeota archaeon]
MPSKSKKKKEISWFEKYEFPISLFSFIVFLFLIGFLFGGQEKIQCGDSTFYGSCSITKPYYCEQGILIEKAPVCGCGELSRIDGNSCITDLQTEPKNIQLQYLLDGEEKTLDFTVYQGLSDYVSDLPRSISYSNGEKPVRADFKFKVLDEEKQRELLLPLVVAIQNLTKDKEEQARIAISLVQNIEFGFSEKKGPAHGVNYSRYPYEVLYDIRGICGEKSELLTFLLRELGYGTAIFYNQPENHESVGIKCPVEESYKGTGYCFVETTGPSIITDDSIEYVGGIVLESEPEIILISDGYSLPQGLQEYRDAELMERMRQGKFVPFRNFELKRLKERYGLVEVYYPD